MHNLSSIEQEDIHTQTIIQVGVISFLIFLSQINQKQTQVFDLTNKLLITADVFSMFRSKNHFVACFFFSAL